MQHLIWTLFWILGAALLSQLTANVPGREVQDGHSLGLLHLMRHPEEALGWLSLSVELCLSCKINTNIVYMSTFVAHIFFLVSFTKAKICLEMHTCKQNAFKKAVKVLSFKHKMLPLLSCTATLKELTVGGSTHFYFSQNSWVVIITMLANSLFERYIYINVFFLMLV